MHHGSTRPHAESIGQSMPGHCQIEHKESWREGCADSSLSDCRHYNWILCETGSGAEARGLNQWLWENRSHLSRCERGKTVLLMNSLQRKIGHASSQPFAEDDEGCGVKHTRSLRLCGDRG
jgi:hypothetical protein